jgi:uncharacterized protein YqgC (DUF456 family)
MATGLLTILYFFAPSVIQPISETSIKPILLMVFILTYIIPLISIGMLKITSSISSMKLSDRKERLMPFFFVTIYYGLTTYLFASKIALGHTLLVIFSTITAVIFLVAVFTKIFKISAHSAGAWGMIGFMLGLHFKYPDSRLLIPILVGIVIAGLINSSRLFLNEHNLKEVGYGSLLGFVVCFGAIFILT